MMMIKECLLSVPGERGADENEEGVVRGQEQVGRAEREEDGWGFVDGQMAREKFGGDPDGLTD